MTRPSIGEAGYGLSIVFPTVIYIFLFQDFNSITSLLNIFSHARTSAILALNDTAQSRGD
jgi:hypothetical protein